MKSGNARWIAVGIVALCLWSLWSDLCRGEAVGGGAMAGPYAVTTNAFVRNWLVVGPFPNLGNRVDGCKGWGTDYLSAYGGEAGYSAWANREVTAVFAESDYWLAGEAKLKWEAHTSATDRIDLGSLISYPPLGLSLKPLEYVTGYAFCLVESPVERPVTIALGADDDYRVWLNHAYVGGKAVFGGCVPDSFTHETVLKKGLNPLLIKCGTDSGGWRFCVRFLDSGKKPVTDLRIYLPEQKP